MAKKSDFPTLGKKVPNGIAVVVLVALYLVTVKLVSMVVGTAMASGQ